MTLAQSPGNVTAGLHMWLKADAGIAGSAPVTAWSDQTGVQADAISASDGPELLSDDINFNPSLNFTTNNKLDITGGILGVITYDDLWVYSVVKYDGASNNAHTFDESTTSNDLRVKIGFGSSKEFRTGGSSINLGGSKVTTTDYNMWTYGSSSTTSTPSGTNQSIYRDGTILNTGGTSATTTGNGSIMTIGNDNTGTTNDLNGRLAELIFYTDVPTAQEHEQIQSYLALKYSIQKNSVDDVSTGAVDESDYFASDGTVVWDNSANSGFNSNIIGIAKDDDTALDQPKSSNLSSLPTNRITLDKGVSFSTDMTFLVVGDNAAEGNSVDVSGFDSRMSRVWKADTEGTPGTISVTIDVAGVGFDLTNPASNFALVIDGDGVFAIDAATHTIGASFSGTEITFTDVPLGDGEFFTVAGPVLSEGPGNVITGLHLWLRADAGIAGSAPVTAWSDQIGAHADAISASDGPELLSNDINFNPSLNFASNNKLDITGGILGTITYDELWVYSVVKYAGASNNAHTFDESTTTSNDLRVKIGFGSNKEFRTGGNSLNVGGGTVTTTDYNMWTYGSSSTTSTPSGTNQSIYRDGTLLASGGASATTTGIGSTMTIGNDNAGTTNDLNGKLAELIFYTDVPTAQEHEQIQSYLALKYSIQKNSVDDGSTGAVDESDYFASDGTVVWDNSANSGFNNNIIGIAKDDDTALDQPKSSNISSLPTNRLTLDKGASFSTDMTFLVVGDNAAEGNSADVSGFGSRMSRVWKADTEGTPGTISVTIDVAGVGFNLTNPASNFALVIDGDGVFAIDAATHTIGASFSGTEITFTDVPLGDGEFFTVAGPVLGEGPGNVITGLHLWLKADAGIAGSAPVTAWSDQTGAQADAISASDGPELFSDDINFNPSLNFTTNNKLDITGGVLGTITYDELWVYSVVKYDAVPSNAHTFDESTTTSNDLRVKTGFGSSKEFRTGGNSISVSGVTTTDYNMWTYGSSSTTSTPSGTNQSIYRDGTLLASGGASATTTGIGSTMTIGNDNAGTSNDLNGKLAELIFYTDVPTAQEHEQIQSYLALKYSIQKNSVDDGSTGAVDESDYFASDGTVVWDNSANSGFNNNIIGIVKDDDTALDQPKSSNISSLPTNRITLDKGASFSSDMTFLVVGDNAAEGNSADVSGFDSRMSRVWKADTEGTPGTISVTIDVAGVGFNLTNPASNFALVIDGDGVFAIDAATHTIGASFSGTEITFTDVPLGDGEFFTVAGPVLGEGPGNVITGLHLWLKADAGIAGSAPVTAWSDQTGAQADAISASDGPELFSDDINFNPSLNFTTNNKLDITGGVLGTITYDELWVYSVVKYDAVPSNAHTFDESTTTSNDLHVKTGFGSSKEFRTGGNSISVSGVTTTDYNMWTYGSSSTTSTPSGTNQSIYRDGTLLASGGTSATTTGIGSTMTIGNDNTGTTNDLNGKLAELIFYTDVPTAQEHEQIQSYLALKYSIQKNSVDDGSTGAVDESDYFASDGTVVWDNSANSGFNNNIIGIAKDDDTALDQPKSSNLSTLPTNRITLDKGASFSTDMTFLVVGDNAAEANSADVSGFDSRMARVWKADTEGTPGTISVTIDVAGVGFNLTNPASNFALVIDGDGVFAIDAATHTIGASFSGTEITFTDVPLGDGEFFTVAGPVLSEGPGNVITGLHLWLRADAGIAGSAPVTAWSDQTGAQADAISASDGPELLSGDVNFNPSLNFTSNDKLDITGGILGTITYDELWIYSVVKHDAAPSEAHTFDESTTSNDLRVKIGFGSTKEFRTGGNSISVSGVTTTDYNMWTYGSSSTTSTPSGTNQSIYRDGTLLASGGTSATTTGIGSTMTIGNDNTGTTNDLNGRLAELIFYTDVPTAQEHEQIQSYLALKYSIQKNSVDDGSTGAVDESDYFASDGTVVWDNSANSGFNSNIIGIAKDDDTALEQKQSTTLDDSVAIYLNTLLPSNSANAGVFSSDKSFVVIGDNQGKFAATPAAILEMPVSMHSRIEREWKVINTNFDGTFSVDIQLNALATAGGITLADLRLLVDSDGDFSDATVYSTADGITFSASSGKVTIGNISNTEISINSSTHITLASVSSSTPLPVELLDFNVRLVDDSYVEINWRTAIEINNDYFTIERSRDSENWDEIATVAGAGNSSIVLTYNYRDDVTQTGALYYRLKQTDFDGTNEYIAIDRVEVGIVFVEKQIKVYPNPTSDGRVFIDIEHSGTVKIEIYNQLGQQSTVFSKVFENFQSGRIELDISGLSTGFYLLKVNGEVSSLIVN